MPMRVSVIAIVYLGTELNALQCPPPILDGQSGVISVTTVGEVRDVREDPIPPTPSPRRSGRW